MSERENRCSGSGACVEACPEDAIAWGEGRPVTDWDRCERCGICAGACFADARERIGREMSVEAVMAEILRDAIALELWLQKELELGNTILVGQENHFREVIFPR